MLEPYDSRPCRLLIQIQMTLLLSIT